MERGTDVCSLFSATLPRAKLDLVEANLRRLREKLWDLIPAAAASVAAVKQQPSF